MHGFRAPILFSAVIAVTTIFSTSTLATITPVSSGTKTYFGSQGTGYQDANPVAGFTPVGVNGPYPAGAPLPNLPAPSGGGLPFAGGGLPTNFTDPLVGSANTSAFSIIDDFYNPGGTSTSDVNITFPVWFFVQGTTAPSYAYQQINFIDTYQSTAQLSASSPVFPIFISGTVSPGGTPFVQFDAAITYSWTVVNADGTTGATSTLGTLNYSWQTLAGGPFGATVNNTGSLAATPAGGGLLTLNGYAWVAGDPFEINISTVPEPTSLGLLAIGALALLRRRK